MRPMITREILLIKYCFMSAQMTQRPGKLLSRATTTMLRSSFHFPNLVHSQADAEGPPTRSSPAAATPATAVPRRECSPTEPPLSASPTVDQRRGILVKVMLAYLDGLAARERLQGSCQLAFGMCAQSIKTGMIRKLWAIAVAISTATKSSGLWSRRCPASSFASSQLGLMTVRLGTPRPDCSGML